MSNTDQTGFLASQSQLQGRYIIIKTVGEGGMGSVYKAIDTQRKNRLVAIKEMSLNHYQNPAKRREAEELFRREAEMLSKLSHPNLPRVYAFFNENGRSYLVMHFIRGKTLGQLMTEGDRSCLPVEDTLNYALQLCDALSYLHQQTPPVIFRDLKPSNVMVTAKGNIYLIDFGIARVFKQGLSHDTQKLGTPGFASPEQYGSGQTGPRSDLYSLGATLHYCLTGKDPRLNQPTLFHFLPAHDDNPQVPLDLSKLIQRLIASKEEQRPPDAETVGRELLSIQQQASNANTNITSSYDLKIASKAQLSSSIIHLTSHLGHLGTWWVSTIVPLMANVYSILCAWFLQAIVLRSKRLYRNGIRVSSTSTREFWRSLSSKEARWLAQAVWKRQFIFLFVLSAIGMISTSLYMLIILHYSFHLIAFYLCISSLLQFCIAYTNQRVRHPLARSIIMVMTFFLLFIAITLFTLPEVQPIIEAITFNQLLSLCLAILITVSLLRPKKRLGWIDHVCLATVAVTYALLLSGVGTQVQLQLLSMIKQMPSASTNNAAVSINYILMCGLCAVMFVELARCKHPFTGTDRLLLFSVALVATPMQFFYGLQEIPHLSLLIFHTENTIKTSSDLISFNTLLTGVPVITALLWVFIAPGSSYLSRLPLLPLALACLALQSFLGPIAHLSLLKPPPYPLASSLGSIIHLNQLTTFGLSLIIVILFYHRQHPFKWFEQFSLFYVAIVCALLQSAAWDIEYPFTSVSVHSQSPQGTTIAQSQLYLSAVNKLLGQALILIIIPVLVITISSIFLHLAGEFAWIDQQLTRVKQRFNWLDQLVLRLNHLILLATSITSLFLLWLANSDIAQLSSLMSVKFSKQLIIAFLLIASLIALVRISSPFSNIDRWIILINVIACDLLLFSGHAQQTSMQHSSKITSVKPWLADPQIVLPPQGVAFGLLLIALVSLMWIRRRIPQTYRSMLKIGFGLTLVCAALQWFFPAFLLVGLIMLTLSVLVAIQVEQA
jgi:serine/threonine protein kinase